MQVDACQQANAARLRAGQHVRAPACVLAVVFCTVTLAACYRADHDFTASTTARTRAPASASASTIPLPSPALLDPQPEPDCEFKSGEPKADELRKLDYERQCYRHAEINARRRLQLLQSAVDTTIKAVKRNERRGS
jgi:hypothetical protein